MLGGQKEGKGAGRGVSAAVAASILPAVLQLGRARAVRGLLWIFFPPAGGTRKPRPRLAVEGMTVTRMGRDREV